jgi:hypothetical protein
MLRFETFYESIGLPEFDRVAINRGPRDPSRLVFIGTADIDPADDAAVRPDNVSPVLFHLAPRRSAQAAAAAAISLASVGATRSRH